MYVIEFRYSPKRGLWSGWDRSGNKTKDGRHYPAITNFTREQAEEEAARQTREMSGSGTQYEYRARWTGSGPEPEVGPFINVEYSKNNGPWRQSGNSHTAGEFHSREEAELALSKNSYSTDPEFQYRISEVPKKEKKMKIGEYEVKDISRDSVSVGCQKVTREEVEAVLAEMDKVPEFTFVPAAASSYTPGSVWVEKHPTKSGAVSIKFRGKDGSSWYLAHIGKDGITLAASLPDGSIQLEDGAISYGYVKVKK